MPRPSKIIGAKMIDLNPVMLAPFTTRGGAAPSFTSG
jgi:hypothetical protein